MKTLKLKALLDLRWAAVALVVLVFSAVVGCDRQSSNQALRIGAMFPLSGSAAQYGDWGRKGAEMAKDEINSKGGVRGVPIEIVYEDTQAQQRQAVEVVNKLIDLDKASAIVTIDTPSTLAAVPIVDRAKTVLITLALQPDITSGSRYVFRNNSSFSDEVSAMVDYLYSTSLPRKAAVIHVTTDFGQYAATRFQELMRAKGSQVDVIESYDLTAKDFRGQLARIKAVKPDLIYIVGYKEVGSIMRQASDLGIKTRFAGTTGFQEPQVITDAGKAAEGAVYSIAAFDPASTEPATASFESHFKVRYGTSGDNFSAAAYDSIYLLAQAATQHGTGPEALRDYLATVGSYSGASGKVDFTKDRDAHKPIAIKQIQNGQFVRIK
jgi:branched-chain amino acid transport system substrate-binding protein